MDSKTLRPFIYSLTVLFFLGCAANTITYPGPNYRDEPISYATIKFTRSQKFMGGGCDHWVFDACKDIEPNSIIGIWTSENKTMPILSTHINNDEKFTLFYLHPEIKEEYVIIDNSGIRIIKGPLRMSPSLFANKRFAFKPREFGFTFFEGLLKNNIESIVPIPADEADNKTFNYLYLRRLFTVGSIAPGDTIVWKAKPGRSRLAVVVICPFGGPPFYEMSDPIDIKAGYTYHVDYKFKMNMDHVFKVNKTRDY